MENNNKRKKTIIILLLLLLLLLIFICYKQFIGMCETNEKKGLYVRSISYDSINREIELRNSELHIRDNLTLHGEIALSKKISSSIRYRIEIYNNTNDKYYFDGLLLDNIRKRDIVTELSGLKKGRVISKGKKIICYLKFRYKHKVKNNRISTNISFIFKKQKNKDVKKAKVTNSIIKSKAEPKVNNKKTNQIAISPTAKPKDNNYINNNTVTNDYKIQNSSIFCWNISLLTSDAIDNTIEKLEQLSIKSIYVPIPDDYSSIREGLIKLYNKGYDIYKLDGDPSWFNEKEEIKRQIDKFSIYRSDLGEDVIKGIILDIEPYGSDEYQRNIPLGFETYVNTVSEIYSYCHERNIKVINTIPYWYDVYYKDKMFTSEENAKIKTNLEKLFTVSDEISVMNYYKSAMISNIEEEMALAKKYNKKIESIAEFSKPAEGVPESISFYVEQNPVQAAHDTWKKVYNYFNYKNLSFSYHNLSEILDINKELVNYEFEFVDRKNNKITDGKYTIKFNSGAEVSNNMNREFKALGGLDFTVSIANSLETSLVKEEVIDKYHIKRTYKVLVYESYVNEFYAKSSNGIDIKSGKLKITEIGTGEEMVVECRGLLGYFYVPKLISNKEYRIIYIDKYNNEYSLLNAVAKDNNEEDVVISKGNGNIEIPNDIKDSNYIVPILTFDNVLESNYQLEVYPSNNINNQALPIKEGRIKLINTRTGEVMISDNIVGSDGSGYYTRLSIEPNIRYQTYLVDSDENIIGNIESYTYGDGDRTEKIPENDTIIIPSGLDKVLYPVFTFKLK